MPFSESALASMLGPWVCARVNQRAKPRKSWAKLLEGILVSRTVDMSFGLKFRFHAGKEEETKKTPRSRGPFLTRL